ncbi:hypothetical protein EJ03DRAFT_325808 [Teratosphaeria nubilosa]|uniref:Uncharacterized protein n=1 Tax=Teratosphaeria nubilosa TaxID=161662 RepID=A0A6G1LEK8_9PEZI|nr:hypothetical protein EJ03DRAFT_325808 [Teratosphaeria nubilosa]
MKTMNLSSLLLLLSAASVQAGTCKKAVFGGVGECYPDNNERTAGANTQLCAPNSPCNVDKHHCTPNAQMVWNSELKKKYPRSNCA